MINRKLEPPKAQQIRHEMELFEDVRIDPYFWMNKRDAPEVIQHLKKENDYATASLKETEGLQEVLFEEIKARIVPNDDTVPYLSNGYYYQAKYQEEKEFPFYYRKKEGGEKEELFLDANERAEGKDFYQLGGLSVSPDNEILAIGEDFQSRRLFTVRFKYLETGAFLNDELENTSGQALWANDNESIFYVVKDETTLRPFKVFRHRLGTPVEEDIEVYHEKDDTFYISISKTKSKKYILIGSFSTLTDEFRLIDANKPEEEWKLFQERDRDSKLEYSIYHKGDRWLIRTNLDAENFRLMETGEANLSKAHWKEVVPHKEDTLLEDVEVFENFTVLTERRNALTQLRVLPEASEEYIIDFPEPVYIVGVGNNRVYESNVLRFDYESLTAPSSEYDFDMKTKERILLKQDKVLGGFNASDYKTERVWVEARDGVEVPVSLVYKKSLKKDKGNPLLLYGYGSYGISIDPHFSVSRISLLDRGFVYAIAHIRGGEEMGRKWYEDGKLLNKKHTFEDFIDCGLAMIEKAYADPEKLFAYGGSAGGLLMGAVINMKPDLWKGVIAAVPFVDVLTTMLDTSIPLTTGEYDEWGNPNEKVYYDYMKSYSPYDNIESKIYPDVLITTGYHDSQVQYWEPAKWAVKLRDHNEGEGVILFHTNMEAGHSGKYGRYERFREVAMHYAFLIALAE